MVEVRDKVVIVTGASSGIGRESAILFAKKGAVVVVTARREDQLRELAGEIESAGGRVMVHPGDITDESLCNDLVDRVVKTYGQVDVLLNNAGYGARSSITSIPTAEIIRMFQVNVFGYFYMARAVIPHMVHQGSGHILNVSSMIVEYPGPHSAYYTSTKAAIVGWSRSMRVELEPLGVKVTEVYPGFTATDFFVAEKDYTGRPSGQGGMSVPGTQSPAKVAQSIVHAVEHPVADVYPFSRDGS